MRILDCTEETACWAEFKHWLYFSVFQHEQLIVAGTNIRIFNKTLQGEQNKCHQVVPNCQPKTFTI